MVERYEKLFERAMKLFKKHGEGYRTMVGEYESLLLEKRILGIRPLNKIKGSVLKEWPEIPLLDCGSEEEAKELLSGLEESELANVVIAIYLWTDSYVYNTLKAHIYDYGYEIRNHDRPKNPFGVDPDKCHGNGTRSYRTSSRED